MSTNLLPNILSIKHYIFPCMEETGHQDLIDLAHATDTICLTSSPILYCSRQTSWSVERRRRNFLLFIYLSNSRAMEGKRVQKDPSRDLQWASFLTCSSPIHKAALDVCICGVPSWPSSSQLSILGVTRSNLLTNIEASDLGRKGV